MKSVRLHAVGGLHIHEDLVPGDGEKLVCVKTPGVCGLDLHWFSEAGIGDAQLAHPRALRHEFAGETKDGQRVAP